MDKYKRLMTNTILFAISSFGSKLLVFVLMPFYTRILKTDGYGTVDLIVQASNFIMPIATIGINNAIIRFGLERGSDKKAVFTIGTVVIAIGFAFTLLFSPLVGKFEFINSYTAYMYMYVFVASFHGLTSQFVRTIGYVRLYAFDGILATVLAILFNILFLGAFDMGIEGYMWAMILTDLIAVTFLILVVKLYRFFDLKRISKALARQMLAYSIPLIPNTICNWFINISSRFIITAMISVSANGIYSVSSKIPSILLIVANIFGEAWQISAISETEGRTRFFSKVCSAYQAIAFTMAAGLIAGSKIATSLFASKEFFEAWRYMPFLVVASTFACIANFLTSVYMVEKKSVNTFITTLIGAAINISLTFLFIKLGFGCMGVAAANLVSYIVMFIIRATDTRKYIKIKWNIRLFNVNMILIFGECFIMLSECAGHFIISCVIAALVVLINSKSLLHVVRQRFSKKQKVV